MFLTCPSCAAKFRIRPDIFSAGPRKVRCARCGHVWVGGPEHVMREAAPEPRPVPEPDPEPDFDEPIADDGGMDDWDALRAEASALESDPVPEPEPEPQPDLTGMPPLTSEAKAFGDPKARRTPSWVWAGWVLIAAVLVLTGLSLAFLKPTLTAAWPPIERLYDIVGNAGSQDTGPAVGYRIEKSSLSEQNGRRRMEIQLNAINMTGEDQPLPIAAIDLIDQAGSVMRTVHVRLPEDPLSPHESRQVPLVLDDVPSGLDRVRASVSDAAHGG